MSVYRSNNAHRTSWIRNLQSGSQSRCIPPAGKKFSTTIYSLMFPHKKFLSSCRHFGVHENTARIISKWENYLDESMSLFLQINAASQKYGKINDFKTIACNFIQMYFRNILMGLYISMRQREQMIKKNTNKVSFNPKLSLTFHNYLFKFHLLSDPWQPSLIIH